MTSLSSVELNYLVFRYLQESGFLHSAFSFGHEASINKSPIDGNMVPPGALITFVQKGLQYFEMEANLSTSDTDVDEDFSFLQPIDLITKDVNQLREIIKEKKKALQKYGDKGKGIAKEHGGIKKRERDEKDRGRVEQDKERSMKHGEQIERGMLAYQDDNKAVVKTKESGLSRLKQEGPKPMDISMTSTSQSCQIPSSDVTILEGHTSEVCACAWSPTGSLLASGSGDSSARIWSIAEGSCRSSNVKGRANVMVLEHVKSGTNEKSKDVTTLDWNGEGTLLATGSYDGQARIWSTNGELRSTLSRHKGPIFSLKWNKKGDYIVTGSCDKTAIVWDVKAGQWKQQFEFHTGPILDVDWRNNVLFVTSSTDKMIYLWKVGDNRPIKSFIGHQPTVVFSIKSTRDNSYVSVRWSDLAGLHAEWGEVNCVKWDRTGSLLASCSDDTTAKIWSMKHDIYVHDLREHTKEIYTIRWSPTGPGTNNPNQKLVLASASFDTTVKLWDVELGKCLRSLNGHSGPAYSVAFSPNGQFLASGSLDKSINVWSLNEGKIVKTYKGNGGIFEVCWNKEGDKIAACFANSTVCVMDFRM